MKTRSSGRCRRSELSGLCRGAPLDARVRKSRTPARGRAGGPPFSGVSLGSMRALDRTERCSAPDVTTAAALKTGHEPGCRP